MNKIIKILYTKLARVYFFIRFIILSVRQMSRRLPEDRPKIIFHLMDDRLYRDGDGSGRYAYLIMNLFSEGGYSVFFYKYLNFAGFMGLGRYGRFSYFVKTLKFISRLPDDTENYIYAFDNIDAGILDKAWEKRIYVNVLKPAYCKISEVIWIPYFFHPYMYKLKQDKRILGMRKTPKKIRAFFGGNTTIKYYNNPALRSCYGQMSRSEGVNALMELGDKAKLINRTADYRKVLNGASYRNECFIFKTDRAGFIRHEEWTRGVVASDFFVCLSGTDLPMCHNAIESMAVGTIPIISYSDWFFPSLEHKKNAIIYTDKADMILKIKEVFEMKKDEIQCMRENVLQYYDTYLVSGRFIQNVERTGRDDATIMLHPRLVPTPQEEQVGQAAIKEMNSYFIKKEKISAGSRDKNG